MADPSTHHPDEGGAAPPETVTGATPPPFARWGEATSTAGSTSGTSGAGSTGSTSDTADSAAPSSDAGSVVSTPPGGGLPTHAADWLSERLGPLTTSVPVPVTQVEPPPTRLRDAAAEALAAVVGVDHLDATDAGRLRHLGGQSYLDVLRRRSGVADEAPDAIVAPSGSAEVAQVLATAEEHDVAVVPFGGGTSVVGGVRPACGGHHAVIALDLGRMDRMLDVDPTASTATFEPGVTGPAAEEMLAPHGLMLGHLPQSFERATLGGYVATRSAGQASTGYGRIDDLVVGLHVVTPRGELQLGSGTPNAAGPDLRALFIGSEGALGVITKITLRVRALPPQRRYEMWAFPSFRAGVACARALAQHDLAPEVFRLSDESETEVTRAQLDAATARPLDSWLRARRVSEPVFCVFGWEGTTAEVRRRRQAALTVVRRHHGIGLGRRGGERWRAHRFDAPYQRDVLLDLGLLVETLETATTWTRLTDLHEAVRSALRQSLDAQQSPPIVLTHVSHLYPTGASLYFTVLARRAESLEQAHEQWHTAKKAASEAILASGGTITHHHAIGRDHASYLGEEIGTVGLAALRAVKAELDPAAICNPGVLLADV